MDRNWKVSSERVEASELHGLIVQLDFPTIYTTNYDRNLEVAFEIHKRPYAKIANARDLANTPLGATQIIKFHGDFDDDSSLVLAETDYFKRLAFDSPIDVKFQADALARTVLFIGYSMSDMNIRLLLHRLWETWHTSGYEKERPPSYVFMTNPNPVQEAILNQWGITVVTGENTRPEESLVSFLRELRRLSSAEPSARKTNWPSRRASDNR
jgi:hypothetical protein